MSFSMSSWFRGIKGKLLIVSILPVVGFVVVYFTARTNFSTLNSILNTSNNDMIPNIAAVGEMRQARNKFGYQLWAAMSMPTAEKRKERLDIARGAIEEFEKGFKTYMSIPSPAELEATDKQAQAVYDEYINQMKNIVTQVESGKPEAFEEVKHQMDGRLWELGLIMNKMTSTASKVYNDSAAKNTKTAEQTVQTANMVILLTTVIASLAIFASMLVIAIRLSAKIGSVALRLTEAGGGVASSVGQLNEAGNSLSQSSTEAAASLEETVASLEELTSMVQMNSDNAKQAAALSATSREAAEKGEREIQSLIQSMTQISKSSKKIEEIISVIDDIAFQTNLLALNAAVEAARAGEQGKGFAVVAEAVRALALRSASAAKEIEGLIKESVSQIEAGSKTADQSGAVLMNIVTSVKKVSDLNNEIAAASSEQTTGIQQITKAMNQLDQASQSNAASAEEIAATSGEIHTLATTAQHLVMEVNEIVLGNQSTKGSPVVSPEISPVKEKAAAKPEAKVELKKSNVIPLKKSTSQEVIPFDEDHSESKVGTTEGF